MATLSFRDARASVLRKLRNEPRPATCAVSLSESDGRILAEAVLADRDSPASARSVRDGFAVRSADLPGELRVVGEIRAGSAVDCEVHAGDAVEIMTGAPVPPGADAVVMIEHVARHGNVIRAERAVAAGENINPRGHEARAGDVLLSPGARIGYSEIAVLAATGITQVTVYRRPSVAILATGDEIVEIAETPLAHQVRNSNAYSLAAQVRRCGGEPVMLPVARDNMDDTRALIERGLRHDLLLVSGGVSAGKYDLVEPVLASLGAEFFFTRVQVQPGQPLVFGRVRGTFFFGLPGNPLSTMVTFEVFARAAVETLAGVAQPLLPITMARLTEEFRCRAGLTRFLPAVLDAGGVNLTPAPWRGSADVRSLARANAFLMTEPERDCWAAGDWIQVLMK